MNVRSSNLLSEVGEALVSEVEEGWLLLLTSCLRLLLQLLLPQQQEAVVGKAALRRRSHHRRGCRILVFRPGLEKAMLAAGGAAAAARTALPVRGFDVARGGRGGRRR